VPELIGNPGTGVVRGRWLQLHNAYLAKHGEHPLQRFRIASADSLLPSSKPQEPGHYLAIQILDIDMFLFKPPTEIGDYDDLLSDRVLAIALFGHAGRIGVEVFTQRTLA
jgi:hypothetical protein